MNQSIAAWAQNMLILDESDLLQSVDPMLSFAKDELLLKQAAQHHLKICRIWRHPNGFVLGQQDARLPFAKQAMEWLQSNQYLPIVRNSGGAAVPLDDGVVNISLIFPSHPNNKTNLKEDFEKMYQLISIALAENGSAVQKGEIRGAYCPGDYDLSINDRKFCGIAQRRLLNAYCVQAFVVASGIGKHRTSLVRRFYEIAANGDAALKYPNVTDESTASLEELTSLKEPVHTSFTNLIKQVLLEHNGTILEQNLSLSSHPLMLPNADELAQMAKKLNERYNLTC